jgi:putative NADH-flavin reductase
MKLTIFGGTGGVGRKLVALAVEQGHDVTVVARSPDKVPQSESVTIVQAELDDRDAIEQAIQGADAVLSALGARKNSADQVEIFGDALGLITTAMEANGVERLVSISGAGVILPGDTVGLSRRFVGLLLKLFAKWVSAAKEREYEVIRATDLDWVLVRPPRIVEGEATGNYDVLPDQPPGNSITQGDVAHMMLRCIDGDEWVGRGPIPGYGSGAKKAAMAASAS